MNIPNCITDTKPHYELLDALRGVAALLVLWYHVHEGFAFAGGGVIQGINHGYLAVDFFFMLSGFVISYAYDDRWSKLQSHFHGSGTTSAAFCESHDTVVDCSAQKPDSAGKGQRKPLTLKEFFRRRLVRLHPMVVLGAVLGAVTFMIQGSMQWDGTHVTTSIVMIALLAAMFMIPTLPGQEREIRGNGEMFPLNGPAWSLFFEYIGNILYALFIRKLSNRALAVLTGILCIALAWFTMFDISGENCLGVGWRLDIMNFTGGLLRMMFPFSLGMLISRKFKPANVKGTFWICSAILAALFFVPYIDGSLTIWKSSDTIAHGLSGQGAPVKLSLNGIFEAACIILIFPCVLWLGASGSAQNRVTAGISRFLGDISFPLYIIHYPIMYLFYAWLIRSQHYTLAETWPAAIGVCLLNIILAWLALKFYDEPIRRWLNRISRARTGCN